MKTVHTYKSCSHFLINIYDFLVVFSHLKRNWTWNPRDVKFEWLIFKAQQLTAAESLTQPTPKAIQQKKEPAKKPKEPQANKRIVYPKLGLSVPIAEASGGLTDILVNQIFNL